MSSGSEETVLTPQNAETLAQIEVLLQGEPEPLSLVTDSGVAVTLPDELRRLLTTAVSSMQHGQAVTLVPLAMRLTTQQAADLLGVSRPTLIKLLEEGHIRYETPNRHRRIRLVYLLAFQAARRTDHRASLGEMAREAQDLGLYEETQEDYEAALVGARQKQA
jgi:excisionase family DNA binding protein